MRAAWIILLVLATSAARAQEDAITVVAHNVGAPGSQNEAPYWFEIEGLQGRDPPLRLQPGAHVTLTLRNEGDRPHALHVGAPVDRSTGLVEPNGTATLAFDVPASGLSAYWCDAHRSIGMLGPIDLGAGPAEVQADAQRADLVPAEAWAVPLGLLAALALRRRAG